MVIEIDLYSERWRHEEEDQETVSSVKMVHVDTDSAWTPPSFVTHLLIVKSPQSHHRCCLVCRTAEGALVLPAVPVPLITSCSSTTNSLLNLNKHTSVQTQNLTMSSSWQSDGFSLKFDFSCHLQHSTKLHWYIWSEKRT